MDSSYSAQQPARQFYIVLSGLTLSMQAGGLLGTAPRDVAQYLLEAQRRLSKQSVGV